MIRFRENFQLDKLNTFGIKAKTRYFFEFTEIEDIQVFFSGGFEWQNLPILILGGGSNLLFAKDFEGLVIHPNIPGIKVVNEDKNNVLLEVGCGVEWDNLVDFCVSNGWGGLENLSLIPGKVGAVPVQNIGAYGVEVKDFIESVSGFDLKSMNEYTMDASDCQFGYRDSIFKNQLRNCFIVTSVTFRLDKFPDFVLDYGDLKKEVTSYGEANLRNIRKAIIHIRESKLPAPEILGNAGSFFKNPIIEMDLALKIKASHEMLPTYPESEGFTKLAAGWLIENCGWKGYREGDVGVHEKQALVLVNYGKATGKQLYELSEKIKQSVFEKFGVELEREVNVIE